MDLKGLFSRICQLIQDVIGPLGGLAAIPILSPTFVCIMCQSGDITFRILPINPLARCFQMMGENHEKRYSNQKGLSFFSGS